MSFIYDIYGRFIYDMYISFNFLGETSEIGSWKQVPVESPVAEGKKSTYYLYLLCGTFISIDVYCNYRARGRARGGDD